MLGCDPIAHCATGLRLLSLSHMTSDSEPDPLIGRTVGPCLIEGLLGRGGMSSVYFGRHVALQRPVAVKIIEPPLLNGEALLRSLLLEARAAARLEDPRIVQIYDVGQHGPYAYIVMQLVRGETLEARVRREGPMEARAALAVMREVLGALDAAHRLGVVHRDVKPGNILIDAEGKVRLADFGIAAPAGSDQGEFAGSVEFMPPEQAFGARAEPSGDLYAAGSVFFYLLSGRPPYAGANPGEIMVRHREDPVPDVRALRPEVTPALAELVVRLMAKDPSARPAAAAEVVTALGRHDMLMEVAKENSPFKILPPPLEQWQGFTPPTPTAAAKTREPEAPRLPPDSPLPAPPPPPARATLEPTWVSRGILFLLYAALFGREWPKSIHADWLALGVASAATLAFLYAAGAGSAPRRITGLLAYVGLCVGFYKVGVPGLESWLPPRRPPIELLLVLGLAAAGAGGSLYEGVFDKISPEKGLAFGLLAGSAAGLLVAGAALRVPPEVAWYSGVWEILGLECRAWLESRGAWRWASLLLFYGGVRIFFPDKAAGFRPEGRVISWR